MLTVFAHNMVRTPNGLWPAECVHAVPTGTRIKRETDGVRETYPNGTVIHRKPCARHFPSRVRPVAESNSSVTVSGNASVTDHAYPIIFWGTHGALDKFTATYNVPAAPKVEAGQTVFWWLGVEPTSAFDVLQPVLGWNGFNKPQWTFASWNCCPSGHTHYAPPIDVQPGDKLDGAIDATGTAGEGYEITSAATGVSAQSVLRSDDAVPQVMPLLALETYDIGGAPHCDLLPDGPLLMEDLAATPPIASWGTDAPQGWGAASSCGWSVGINGGTLSATPPSQSRSGREVVEAE